jgi:hypothetical protein
VGAKGLDSISAVIRFVSPTLLLRGNGFMSSIDSFVGLPLLAGCVEMGDGGVFANIC